ncbi:Aladin [Coccomyxa sp. Obi]|nr:Aladin [Coccomyxa sp. Obi]
MAGTANFPEVAFIDIAEKDKGKVTRSSGSEGNLQRREHESAAAHAEASLKLPESVRWLGRIVSDVVSCPRWLQEQVGFLATQPPPAEAPMALHKHTDRLAAADGADRVHICDASTAASTSGRPPSPIGLPAKLALYHDFQQQVTALAWRPLSGNTLAVGCRRGVCLWSLGRCPAGGAPSCKATVAGSSTPAWLSFLRTRGNGVVTALAWSPDGQLLAASSQDAPGFVIFDVTTGEQTSVQAGLAAVSLLEWSPEGSYLLAGGEDGSFRVWETQKWTSLAWSTQGNEQPLAGAAWAPDSRAVILGHRGGRQLAALYFTRPAPALDAQLFPLPLPSHGPGGGKEGSGLAAFAWDAEGEKLAVALNEEGSDQSSSGRIAVFATSYKPIMGMRLLGFTAEKPVQPPSPAPDDQGGLGGAGEGDERGTAPVLAFHKGSLLAVRRGLKLPISLYACSQY